MQRLKYLIWFYFLFFLVTPIVTFGIRPFTIILMISLGVAYYIHWLCTGKE